LGRDDQILLNGTIFYAATVSKLLPGTLYLPAWKTDGVIMAILMHAGPVEFLYYWFHRALHHHYLYSRYHSHHHSSIVTEPITCKYNLHYFLSIFFRPFKWFGHKYEFRIYFYPFFETYMYS
jgi:aldehyde decarbonylase